MIKKATLILLSVLFCALGQTAGAQEVVDQIAVIVDDNVILKSELEQYTLSLAFQLKIDPQKEPEKFENLRKEALENMIVRKVLLTKAKEDSVVVSDRQLESLLEDQINQMVRQLGSEKKVEEYFGMPMRQIRREFRPEAEETILVKTLRDRKDYETQISRREVESFYEAYQDSLPRVEKAVKISHILVQVKANEVAEQRARQRAEDILTRLQQGEDFATLAGQYSEDPGSASNGGDLGTLSRGDLVREFEEVAFSLEPGEISDIVRTQFGFHIIQLISRTGEKIHPRHILIRLETDEQDEVGTIAWLEDIKRSIERGEMTFEEAAEKYSKDPQTADNGGDLGWFEVEQFQLENFRDAVQDLEVGEISNPVKTDFGFHLIRLDKRREARQLDIQEDWEQIEAWALNLKRQKVFEEWVAGLKEDIYIEIKNL